MYEQASNQFLALSKQAAETFLKANAIAVEGFEKLMDIQLRTIEDRVKVATDLMGQAGKRGFRRRARLLPEERQPGQGFGREVLRHLAGSEQRAGQDRLGLWPVVQGYRRSRERQRRQGDQGCQKLAECRYSEIERRSRAHERSEHRYAART